MDKQSFRMNLSPKMKWLFVGKHDVFMCENRPKPVKRKWKRSLSELTWGERHRWHRRFTLPSRGSQVQMCRSQFQTAIGHPVKIGQLWKRVGNTLQWKLVEYNR